VFLVLFDGLDMFRRGAIATGGNMNTSGNLHFMKITLVVWMVWELNPVGWDNFG
jgi:hypothetical protein